jgi:hypothetical protein
MLGAKDSMRTRRIGGGVAYLGEVIGVLERVA